VPAPSDYDASTVISLGLDITPRSLLDASEPYRVETV
jgi:hypothetical protein